MATVESVPRGRRRCADVASTRLVLPGAHRTSSRDANGAAAGSSIAAPKVAPVRQTHCPAGLLRQAIGPARNCRGRLGPSRPNRSFGLPFSMRAPASTAVRRANPAADRFRRRRGRRICFPLTAIIDSALKIFSPASDTPCRRLQRTEASGTHAAPPHRRRQRGRLKSIKANSSKGGDAKPRAYLGRSPLR